MIHVADLHYRYPDTRQDTLKGLTFKVEPGEIFGFLGPSGAGKSTTQRILTGLIRDGRGHIQVLDRDPGRADPSFYERIGVSFETPNHYPKLSGLENLVYFRSLFHGERREPGDLLERLGLVDAADVRVMNYSRGMRVRLGIARMLLNCPDLLFLDEPTAGLDPANARLVKDLIRREKEAGHAAFLTTHDMHVATELCDRVAFLVDGEIQLIDKPQRLCREYGEPVVHVQTGQQEPFSQYDFPLADLGKNPEFQRMLRDEEIRTIHSRESSLEEVFIQVTGKKLR